MINRYFLTKNWWEIVSLRITSMYSFLPEIPKSGELGASILTYIPTSAEEECLIEIHNGENYRRFKGNVYIPLALDFNRIINKILKMIEEVEKENK